MAPVNDDNARLREDNAKLRTLVETLEATIGSLQSALQAQTAAFEKLQREFEQMRRRLLGPKPEKMPGPREESRRRRGQAADPEKARAKRRANAEKRAAVATKHIPHPVPEPERTCQKCGRDDLSPLGAGRVTKLWQYIPGHFICEEHMQETLACTCGEYVVTAPGPQRPFEGAQYGASFIAHLIVAKCVDSIPLHRLERRFERLGIPMSRSTMTDLFHRAAEELEPLVTRLFVMIAAATVVQADETSIKIQDREKRGFIWTFVSPNAIAYRCSPDRNGTTPQEILGGTEGVLVVDGYTGYNRVVGVDGRVRAGCLAHARRKFFEALDVAPEAQQALDLILDIYEVEHRAQDFGIEGTGDHLLMRKRDSAPRLAKLHDWLTLQKGLHPPRSKMGQAIAYTLRSWEALSIFLEDARVPVGRVDARRGGRRRWGVADPAGFRFNTGASVHLVAPFPGAAHRTGRADFPHPALISDFSPSRSTSRV